MVGRRKVLRQLGSVGGGLLWTACGRRGQGEGWLPVPPTMKLTSPAFAPAAILPAPFTCDGTNHSPDLVWDAPPDGTRSLAILLFDLDAPNLPFIHWILYDLSPETRNLPAAIPTQPFLSAGGVQGKNDFATYGYRGPCPAQGTHRYSFRLYALDKLLDLPPGVTYPQVAAAGQGHVLAGAELIGRYRRQS